MELNILRLVTGIAGSSFVTCIYWASMMFTREVSGTATALVSGWGNLGGGVTNLLMGSCFFPLFKWFFSANNDEAEAADRAWRTVCIIPAIPSFLFAYWIIKYSDDSPKGNFHKLWRLGLRDHVFAWKAFGQAARQPNTWILTIHYACCFGVEVTMVNSAAFLFSEKFELQTESAAAIASIFGWMNLFARGMGGFISDIMNVKYKMRGRLVWHIVTLVAQGALIILFGSRTSLAGAIVTMTFFSFFVQTSEGSTYAIVPYVCPNATGSVAGIVGAGGNVGGVIFLMMIQKLDYKTAFFVIGVVVISSSILSLFLILTHQDALLTKPSGSHSGGSSNKG
jgi:NNP family nitrate/nitrite transporter-like MFS transporter